MITFYFLTFMLAYIARNILDHDPFEGYAGKHQGIFFNKYSRINLFVRICRMHEMKLKKEIAKKKQTTH